MPTEVLTRWIGILAPDHVTQSDEHRLAAVLDSCLDRMAVGQDTAFVLQQDPDAAAQIRPLLEIATLLDLRGRFARGVTATN